jgi:hypothetical protein
MVQGLVMQSLLSVMGAMRAADRLCLKLPAVSPQNMKTFSPIIQENRHRSYPASATRFAYVGVVSPLAPFL